MKTILSAALAVMLALSAMDAGAEDAAADRKVDLAIEQQSLADALNEWAKQTGLQLVSSSSEMMNTTVAPSIKGEYTPKGALEELLKGTSLTYEWVSERAVAIREKSPIVPAALQSTGADQKRTDVPIARFNGETWGGQRLAANDRSNAGDPAPARKAASPDTGEAEEVEEIIVTGTFIRGARTASEVTIVDRGYIDKSGYSTLHQVLQTLPQNYGGGDAEGAVNSPGGSASNVGYGSSVNLRGLGAGSTLVLINGQRLAPAGDGGFVDVSLIPLSAVERVEVMPDGASATYGSDAVGGIVNVILRDDYEGSETRLGVGSVSHGDMSEFQASQSIGTSWNNGGLLLNYEFRERGNLDANDREFSAAVDDPYDLLPRQKTQSLLIAAEHDINDRLGLRATALASERRAEQDGFFGLPVHDEAKTSQVTASAGIHFDLSTSWQLNLVGLHSQTKNRNEYTDPTGASLNRRESTLRSLEVRADGPVFNLPGGDVKAAVGGGYRDEAFRFFEAAPEQTRDVTSVFGELLVPIYGESNSRAGLRRLELSLSSRFEEYSDFGDSTNPKIGAIWSPMDGLTFRGTFGKSFRAPTFTEMTVTQTNVGAALVDLPDPASASGTTLAMLYFGKNADLEPERATTRSFGLDLDPTLDGHTRISLTYFDTEYEDRIGEPLPGAELFSAFDRAAVFASIIDRTPDAALITDLAQLPVFFNLHGPFAPEDVEALVDARTRNISIQQVRGIDASATHSVSTALGNWEFGLGSTYLLELSNRITDLAPADDVVGAVYHPADLRARAQVSFSRMSWGASATLNYIDGLKNIAEPTNASVASWTTADLQFTYQPSLIDGLRIALTAINVFDKDPPFVSSPLAEFNIGYDPTNSDPLGRFLTLSFTKSW